MWYSNLLNRNFQLAGSKSRGLKGRDTDFVSSLKYESVLKKLAPFTIKILRKGKNISVMTKYGKVDVFSEVPNKMFFLYQQPKNKIIGVRLHLKKNGYRLARDGLYKNNKKVNFRNYEDLKRFF